MTEPSNSLPPDFSDLTSHARLDVVRAIRQPSAILVGQLLAARAAERNAYVRRAIDNAVRSTGTYAPPLEGSVGVDPDAAAEIEERTRAELADLMAHELKHSALHIEIAAEEELGPAFASSVTRSEIKALQSVARSFAQLASASRGPSIEEVVLADLIAACRAEHRSGEPPIMEGPLACVAPADPDLLRLALANCLRNASEAAEQAVYQPKTTLITWGRTDRDAWIAIHDDGIGLSDQPELLFQPYRTTKAGSGSTGLGLTVARVAMNAFDGDIKLLARDPRGVTCEIRWTTEVELAPPAN